MLPLFAEEGTCILSWIFFKNHYFKSLQALKKTFFGKAMQSISRCVYFVVKTVLRIAKSLKKNFVWLLFCSKVQKISIIYYGGRRDGGFLDFQTFWTKGKFDVVFLAFRRFSGIDAEWSFDYKIDTPSLTNSILI